MGFVPDDVSDYSRIFYKEHLDAEGREWLVFAVWRSNSSTQGNTWNGAGNPPTSTSSVFGIHEFWFPKNAEGQTFEFRCRFDVMNYRDGQWRDQWYFTDISYCGPLQRTSLATSGLYGVPLLALSRRGINNGGTVTSAGVPAQHWHTLIRHELQGKRIIVDGRRPRNGFRAGLQLPPA